MKSDRLQDALGMVREDYVLDAHGEKKRNKSPWRTWGTLAACLCLAAVCAVGVPGLLHNKAPVPEPQPTVTVPQPTTDPGPEGPAPVPGNVVAPWWPRDDPRNSSGDWPVIYNEVDTMPDGCFYCALAGRNLTEEEFAALIPGGLDWPAVGWANFLGVRYEDGRLDENAQLDSVEMSLNEPGSGCFFRIAMWPAGQTSVYSWASQFDPMDYEATHVGSDDGSASVTLFRCGDRSWTSFTCGDVSYYVYTDSPNLYGVVNAIFRSEKTPDLSIIVPNP
ncbi:MAG: hypothetical protein IJL08_05235 [Oscillospiraceae bacterium]|nr:hypothetical protein [Oscillospiraceae bacterium]